MSETSPIAEQANPATKLARDRCSPEDLPPDALQTIPRTEPVVQVSEQINAQLENLSVGAGRTQVEEEEEEEEEDVVNDSGRLVQPDAGGSSSGGLKRIPPSMTRGFPLPVGQAFEDNRKMIWSWLMNDEISTIGICGMGGIGKTTILKHIHNELLQRPDISRHVYWVTVSQDFSIYRLQNLIAKCLDLDLSSEYDILPRAEKLSEELRKKQEWILILDDLWESFELYAVGIPVLKGCKVILTTRSKAVCHQMASQVITEVRPFSEREAWTLFMEKLGHGIALSPEVERIAVDIVRECAGLPLGIIIMAGSLRGVDDPDEWRHTLEKLKGSNFGDLEDEVLRMLKFSYDLLDDALQQCLLYCALFPKGHEIEREELIFYLIDGGIIENMWSREAAFEKGHAMLDTLENACLLERIAGGRAVKMHDLVRDMAVRICKENPSVMEQRRKGIEMAGSNIDRSWNHVEQMNDGGNSTHKTMRQRRKRIVIARSKSGRARAISASEQEHNNVDMAQQREPLFTGEFERANDLTGAGIELPPDTPDDQDELKKLKASKSRDMVDDFKSGWTGAVSASEQEQNNVDVAQQQEPLFLALDSVHHVDRTVPPTIDENYNRREATERLVQLDVGASSFGGLTGNTNETPGDASQPTKDQLCSPSVNNDVIVNDAQQREPMFTGEYEWANDFIGGGIELVPMSETIPITEHANPETEFARDHCSPEELPHDEFQTLPRTEPVVQVLEQSNAGLDNLSVDAGRTQVGVQGMEQGGEEGRVCSHLDMENTGEGSAQHVHRIVPPTIDENYNRREATERLVQPGVGASSFGVCGNHNAISTSQQEQNKEVDNNEVTNVISASAQQQNNEMMMAQQQNNEMIMGMEQGGEEGRVCSQLDVENTGEGSAQHVDRTVPPTIDEKYNRREATERLVQHGVGASSFVVYVNHIAVSTSQQEQNKEVNNVTGDAGTTPAAGIELPRDAPDELKKGSKYRDMVDFLKSGWTLLLTSIIIEIASAVFDQLGYALVGMVLAFVALLLAAADLLIHMAPEERTSLLPCYRRPSTTHSHGTKGKKPGGTIVEYFGLVGAVWQCFYSTVAYAYARQKRDNPIKMTLLPSIFLLCVVISNLIKTEFIDESA